MHPRLFQPGARIWNADPIAKPGGERVPNAALGIFGLGMYTAIHVCFGILKVRKNTRSETSWLTVFLRGSHANVLDLASKEALEVGRIRWRSGPKQCCLLLAAGWL